MRYRNNIVIMIGILLGIITFLLLNVFFFQKGITPSKENNKSTIMVNNKDTLNDEINEILKEEFINLFEEKNYESIMQKYNSLSEEYNMLTDESKELTHINEAATIMNNLKYKNDESIDSSIFQNFKEPNSFVISMLNFKERDKLGLFINSNSLVPTTYQPVDIISCNLLVLGESDSSILKEFYEKGFTNHKLYEIKVFLNNELLTIFVSQNRNTEICKIYTINSDKENDTKFKTVEYYNKINNLKIN